MQNAMFDNRVNGTPTMSQEGFVLRYERLVLVEQPNCQK